MSERDDLEEKFFKPAHDNRPAEPICYGCGVSHAVADLVEGKAAADLLADARALWAVRVLDRRAMLRGEPIPVPVVEPEAANLPLRWFVDIPEHYSYGVGKVKAASYEGASPEAARLAAAEAVYPDLPESVRADLGARP